MGPTDYGIGGDTAAELGWAHRYRRTKVRLKPNSLTGGTGGALLSELWF
jgi:hypothetical protein